MPQAFRCSFSTRGQRSHCDLFACLCGKAVFLRRTNKFGAPPGLRYLCSQIDSDPDRSRFGQVETGWLVARPALFRCNSANNSKKKKYGRRKKSSFSMVGVSKTFTNQKKSSQQHLPLVLLRRQDRYHRSERLG